MLVFATYFDYFKGEKQGFGQWTLPANYLGLGNLAKDAKPIPGAEPWRRNIWVGAPGDYPFIGPYNSLDPEVMRWHIQCAKAAGINGFLLYVLEWEKRKAEGHLQIKQLLNIAAEEQDFFIGFIDHYTSLGAVELEETRFLRGKIDREQITPPILPAGVETPILSFKVEGALQFQESLKKDPSQQVTTRSSEDNLKKSIDLGKDRITEMLNEYKFHPAYLRINGKPVICIPFIDEDLKAPLFEDLIQAVKVKLNPPEDLYVIAIVTQVYNFVDLNHFPNTFLNLKPNKPWTEVSVDCFTSWTPNGMVEASYATKFNTYRDYVRDAQKFGKDSMAPVMPGFNDDDWRPDPKVPAKTLNRAGGENWRDLIRSAIQAKSEFLFIQAWNEWHEGSQIEPSAGYRDKLNRSDPYLYLRILAEELGKAWKIPPPPPPASIDSLRRQEVVKAHAQLEPKPLPQPQPEPEKIFEFRGDIDFQHQTGRAEPDGWSAVVGQDSSKKYLCYGPYTIDIPPGNHQAVFTLMVDNNQADNHKVVTLDIWDATRNKRLGKKDIRRKEFKTPFQYQDFKIEFQNLAGHRLEFRTFWYGIAWTKVGKVIVS